MLIFSIPFLILWKKRLLLVMALAVIFSAGWPLQAYWPKPDSKRAAPARQLKIVYANVNVANLRYESIGDFFERETADILVISEISQKLFEALTPILKDYPFREVIPREDCFGLAVFSRLPVKSMQARYLGEAQLPSIKCVIAREPQDIVLWATHPVPPMGQRGWEMRNEQLLILAEEIKGDSRPHIVVGDLNTAPWCYWFDVLLNKTMKDSSLARGIIPTWPAYFPFFLRIPLDHILIGRDIGVLERNVLPVSGSDHHSVSLVIGL